MSKPAQVEMKFHLPAFSGGVVNSATEAALRTALTGGGTVTFNCDGTIALTGTVAIASSTILNAAGHAITISGSNTVRVFTVNGASTLSLFNLTIANGLALGTNAIPGTVGGSGQGGGVLLNGGTLIASNCLFSSNVAQGGNCGLPDAPFFGNDGNGGDGLGGAISVNNGSLSVLGCDFVGNQARGGAGTSVPVQVINGGNAGSGFGGAVYCATSLVQLVNCQFRTNQTIGADAVSDGLSANELSGGAYGGAVCEWGGIVTNLNGSFTGNQALASLVYYRETSGRPGQGGACFNSGGYLVVAGTSFTSNTVAGGHGGVGGSHSAPGQGGAVFSIGSFQASNCHFGYNQAIGGDWGIANGSDGNGGAVFCAGPSSINQSYFFGNTVRGGTSPGSFGIQNGTSKGGAIYNSNAVSILGCTFSTNRALGIPGSLPVLATPGYGGAIYNVGFCQSTNNTLEGNLAVGGDYPSSFAAADAYGGAVYNDGGSVVSVNNTFALNAAVGGTGSPNGTGHGGSIYNSSGTVNLYNTIVANSTSGSNCFGVLMDGGHNVSSDASAGFSASGSLNNTDPILGPLGNYGGPTPTIPLLAGSPTIDGGNTATAPATDQRGHARPYGAAADIGAFESSPPFFIGGQVSGHTLKDEVTIVIGAANLTTTNLGSYGASVFAAGPYTITPTSPNYLFIPASQPVTVGPDQFGFNFKAYHWNALSLEAVTNGTMDCIVADTNGQTCRVLTSTNRLQWLPFSTNAASSSNYIETFLPIANEPVRFYRTAIP